MTCTTEHATATSEALFGNDEREQLFALLEVFLKADTSLRVLALAIDGISDRHSGSEFARDILALKELASSAVYDLTPYTEAICLQLQANKPDSKDIH